MKLRTGLQNDRLEMERSSVCSEAETVEAINLGYCRVTLPDSPRLSTSKWLAPQDDGCKDPLWSDEWKDKNGYLWMTNSLEKNLTQLQLQEYSQRRRKTESPGSTEKRWGNLNCWTFLRTSFVYSGAVVSWPNLVLTLLLAECEWTKLITFCTGYRFTQNSRFLDKVTTHGSPNLVERW